MLQSQQWLKALLVNHRHSKTPAKCRRNARAMVSLSHIQNKQKKKEELWYLFTFEHTKFYMYTLNVYIDVQRGFTGPSPAQ